MPEKSRAKYEVQAKIIKSVAHPTRLLIIEELSRDEKCVYELTQMIGAKMSTVSRHLSLLKEAGIVVDEKRGTQIYYRINTPCILDLLACIELIMKYNIKENIELII